MNAEEMLKAVSLKPCTSDGCFTPAPEQRDLTYGDHWLEFIDLERWHIAFGTVLPLADVSAAALYAGGDEHQRTEILSEVQTQHLQGNLCSLVFSRLNFEGALETVHQSHVWPISGELMQAMRVASFDVRNLRPGGSARLELDAAFKAQRMHVKAVTSRPPRRSLYEFASEVMMLTRWKSWWGEHRWHQINDREFVLRFPNYADAIDGVIALREGGFTARSLDNPEHIVVKDRSEA